MTPRKSHAKETVGVGFIKFHIINRRVFPLQLYLSNKYILYRLNHCFGKMILYLKEYIDNSVYAKLVIIVYASYCEKGKSLFI